MIMDTEKWGSEFHGDWMCSLSRTMLTIDWYITFVVSYAMECFLDRINCFSFLIHRDSMQTTEFSKEKKKAKQNV